MEAEYCPNCGMLYETGSGYCDFCGYEMDEEEESDKYKCKQCGGIYWYRDELNKDMICEGCAEHRGVEWINFDNYDKDDLDTTVIGG